MKFPDENFSYQNFCNEHFSYPEEIPDENFEWKLLI